MAEKKEGRFCIVPFIQLNTRGQGNLRVCCSISGLPHGIPKVGTIDDVNAGNTGDVFDLRQDAIEEVWDSEFMRDFRMKMIRGEYVKNCEFCYRLEDRGINSKRVNRNRRFIKSHNHVVEEARNREGKVSDNPVWWELRFSTKCNLTCRMCTPALSTRILKEYKSHPEKLTAEMTGEVEMAENLLAGGHLGESEFFRNQLEPFMEEARYLEMRGGEVLVDAEAIRFLEGLSLEKAWAKNMHLDLSSNIVTLSDRHIEIFNGFKSGTLKCSVDGFAEEDEYIRYPSKWSDIISSFWKMRNLHKNWRRVVQTTLSAYQVCSVERLLWFLDEFVQESQSEFIFSFTMVRDTPHLDPEIIPFELRRQAARRVEEFREKSYLCNRSPNREINNSLVKGLSQGMIRSQEPRGKADLEAFRSHTRALDRMRGQRVEQVFPHLAPLFEDLADLPT